MQFCRIKYLFNCHLHLIGNIGNIKSASGVWKHWKSVTLSDTSCWLALPNCNEFFSLDYEMKWYFTSQDTLYSKVCSMKLNPIIISRFFTQVKANKLLVFLVNLVVGGISWASMWAIDGPCWKPLNRKNVIKCF